MEWDKVKNIQESLNRLNNSNVTDDSKVVMLLDGKEVFLHSISIDGSGKTVIIRLDKEEE